MKKVGTEKRWIRGDGNYLKPKAVLLWILYIHQGFKDVTTHFALHLP